MTYQQTLDYLYSQLPMFHRIGSAAYKANLDNTIAICNLLNNPQNKFKSIHVAGTNGKGSTSHMIASILQSSGLKVGLYTSPHLKDFRERIRVNGKMISQKFIIDFVEKYEKEFAKIQPSFFEWTVGLAFDYFSKQKVDMAVIEVGLGGRLDSTNVIHPVVSVITNISYDHQNLLGNTLRKIAGEKAGIIKPRVPVIIGETQSEVKDVFVNKVKKAKSHIYFADEYYRVVNHKQSYKDKLRLIVDVKGKNGKFTYKNLQCELPGLYQKKNILTVLKTIDVLKQKKYPISERSVRNGISNVIKQTGLQGRWQLLSKRPLTIADTGHNEAGIKEVLSQIKLTPHKNLHFVLGMVNDKDISKILSLLPKSATYYFCRASIPRALDQNELALSAKIFGLKGKIYPSVKKALKVAEGSAKTNDLIFIGGSTFVVAEAL